MAKGSESNTTAVGDEEQHILIPADMRSDRADKVLARCYPALSRTRWQKLLASGLVWSDDTVLGQTDRLRPGDCVGFSLPALQACGLEPIAMPLNVVFEDDDLLVVNKSPGVVVHPGAGTAGGTLVHGLLHHCKGRLSGIGGIERPGIVHRIDKDTSGLLLVAKSDRCFQLLTAQFANRSIDKFYLALVHGIPQPATACVDAPIGRHPVHRTRMAVRADGRAARSDYQTLEAFGERASRLLIQIHSGRTHQIRVHMRHIGHPLLGDSLYAAKRRDPVAANRVMLHACELSFGYPELSTPFQLSCPPPPDFNACCAALRGFNG